MGSFYSVVQYAPGPTNYERLNTGVVVFGEGRVFVYFTRKWSYIQQYTGNDVSFVRSFAESLTASALAENASSCGCETVGSLNETTIRQMAQDFSNEIRFTPICGSTLPVAELFRVVSDRFFPETDESSDTDQFRGGGAGLAHSPVQAVHYFTTDEAVNGHANENGYYLEQNRRHHSHSGI